MSTEIENQTITGQNSSNGMTPAPVETASSATPKTNRDSAKPKKTAQRKKSTKKAVAKGVETQTNILPDETHAQQLEWVASAMEALVEGKPFQENAPGASNEALERIIASFAAVSSSLETATICAENVAIGKLDDLSRFEALLKDPLPISTNQKLLAALIAMLNSLKEKTEAASEIANGNLSVVVSPKGHDDVLGHSLVTLQFQIENVLSALPYLSEQTASGLLLERLDTNLFEGDWAQIAESINQTMDTLTSHIDSFPSPVVVIDTEHEVLYANPKCLQAFEVNSFEDLTEICRRILAEAETSTTHCASQTAMQLGKATKGDVRLALEGKIVTFQTMASPIYNASGEITGAIQFLMDLTAQREVESHISAATTLLAEITDELSAASSEMSLKSKNIDERTLQANGLTENLSEKLMSISESAEASQDNIASVSTATEEMASTVTEIAQNAEQARSVADNAVRTVSIASKEVETLEQAAKQISQVTETIVEIAEQTKLLALNATIEAARAGEAGKGFAVVASEVKELAQQTNSATTDIKTKIEAIQAATNRTIKEIRNISAVIGEVNEFVSTIATATEEQAITTRDISENLSQTTSGIAEVTASVTDVASFSIDMVDHIQDMKESAGEISNVSTRIKQIGEKLKTTEISLVEAIGQFAN